MKQWKRAQLYLATWLLEATGFMLIFTTSRALADQHVSAHFLGWLGGLFAISTAVSTAISGLLADRVGYKRIMLLGIGTVIGAILLTLNLIQHHHGLIACYVLTGIGMGAFYPPLTAWLTHGHNQHHSRKAMTRVLVTFCITWNVGVVTGQLVSGMTYQWFGAHMPLWIGVLLATISFLLVASARRRPRDHASATTTEPDATKPHHQTQSNAFARVCWIANTAGAFSVSTIIFLFPKLAVSSGIAADKHGILLTISRVMIVSIYLAMSLSVFWHHRFRYVILVHAMGIVGLVGIALSSNVWLLTLGLLLFSILPGFNYFASLYYSSTGSRDAARGSAIGLHETTLALGMAGGSIVGGTLASYFGDRAPYLLAALIVTTAIVLQTWLYRRFIASRRRVTAPQTADLPHPTTSTFATHR